MGYNVNLGLGRDADPAKPRLESDRIADLEKELAAQKQELSDLKHSLRTGNIRIQGVNYHGPLEDVETSTDAA